MSLVLLLAVAMVCLFGLVVVHQLLLDSELFELGNASWFPSDGDIPLKNALIHGLLGELVPLTATVIAAILVVTTPFVIWLWGVVVLLGLTVALSPILAVYSYEVRPLTEAEATRLAELSDFGCEILVVTDTHSGPVNGYAIGGPFRDLIGISEFALQTLSPEQIAPLLAHEATHHHQRHTLVRGGVSVTVLAIGAAMATVSFDALTPLSTGFLVLLFACERLVAYTMMRRLEYQADAVAARLTSTAAVVDLLQSLDVATSVDQTAVPWLWKLFSTHPTYEDRIRRLQRSSETTPRQSSELRQ